MVEIHVKISTEYMLLQGELTRYTLTSISEKVLVPLFSQKRATVDLKQVSKVDTAGLAWLFYLLDHAKAVNCHLSFINLPEKLKKLIKLSGVEGFLPLP